MTESRNDPPIPPVRMRPPGVSGRSGKLQADAKQLRADLATYPPAIRLLFDIVDTSAVLSVDVKSSSLRYKAITAPTFGATFHEQKTLADGSRRIKTTVEIPDLHIGVSRHEFGHVLDSALREVVRSQKATPEHEAALQQLLDSGGTIAVSGFIKRALERDANREGFSAAGTSPRQMSELFAEAFRIMRADRSNVPLASEQRYATDFKRQFSEVVAAVAHLEDRLTGIYNISGSRDEYIRAVAADISALHQSDARPTHNPAPAQNRAVPPRHAP